MVEVVRKKLNDPSLTQAASLIADDLMFMERQGTTLPVTIAVLSLGFGELSGVVNAERFGVVWDDRTAANANGTALNTAIQYCITNKLGLFLGTGTSLFTDQPLVIDGQINIYGRGTTEWNKRGSTTTGVKAPTAIVLTGTGTQNRTLLGVSSCKSWGGRITNPSPQTGYNDAYYELTSFVNESETADGQTLKQFSAGMYISKAAQGSQFKDFRVMPDGGGTDGYDYYETGSVAATTALTDGAWDVGIYINAAKNCHFENVQAVGTWRMRKGLLVAPHDSDFPANIYYTKFSRCTFSGVGVRSVDHAPITATTTTTFDVPWANDHAFTATDSGTVRLSTNSRVTTSFTYTSVTRVTDGIAAGVDSLRFNGVSPDPTGQTGCAPNYRGGGSSGLTFEHCRLQGFGHPSAEPCEKDDLTGSGVFSTPMNTLEISGLELTEIDFVRSYLETYESVGVFLGDCRHVHLPTYLECNNGARFIAAPARSSAAAIARMPHSSIAPQWETLTPILEPEGSTMLSGNNDLRPIIQEGSENTFAKFAGDDGLFRPDGLQSSRFGFPGHGNALFGTQRPTLMTYTFVGADTSSSEMLLARPDSMTFKLDDDAAIQIEMSHEAENMLIEVVDNNATGEWADLRGKTDAAPGGSVRDGSDNFDATNVDLNGTTGNASHLTFSFRQGAIHFENRARSPSGIFTIDIRAFRGV